MKILYTVFTIWSLISVEIVSWTLSYIWPYVSAENVCVCLCMYTHTYTFVYINVYTVNACLISPSYVLTGHVKATWIKHCFIILYNPFSHESHLFLRCYSYCISNSERVTDNTTGTFTLTLWFVYWFFSLKIFFCLSLQRSRYTKDGHIISFRHAHKFHKTKYRKVSQDNFLEFCFSESQVCCISKECKIHTKQRHLYKKISTISSFNTTESISKQKHFKKFLTRFSVKCKTCDFIYSLYL